jgi:hypothetical protein
MVPSMAGIGFFGHPRNMYAADFLFCFVLPIADERGRGCW